MIYRVDLLDIPFLMLESSHLFGFTITSGEGPGCLSETSPAKAGRHLERV